MKRLIILIIPLLIILALVIGLQKTVFAPKKVHFHAGFQVYLTDKLQNFSGLEYMHEKPCTVNGKPVENDNEQEEKAHLHDLVGDVVHVHRDNATWGDLFTNLKFPIDYVTADSFVNGQRIKHIASYKINAYDSLVIFVGKRTKEDDKLAHAVTTAHIKQTERRSENCGTGS